MVLTSIPNDITAKSDGYSASLCEKICRAERSLCISSTVMLPDMSSAKTTEMGRIAPPRFCTLKNEMGRSWSSS
jgi:hypothetical protein